MGLEGGGIGEGGREEEGAGEGVVGGVEVGPLL